MNQYMRVKPVFATFYPERNHSGQQRENRLSVGSRMEDKQYVLKSQIIQLQTQQNELNEQIQVQIARLGERLNNVEQHIGKIYESGWMEAVNLVQDQMQQWEEQLQHVQKALLSEEQKSQELYSQQINSMKCTVLEQITNIEIEMTHKIEELKKDLKESNTLLHQKLVESNDILKYQKFNEEMSLYLKDEDNTLSPRYKSRSQRLQLQPISEETPHQSFQFLQSQSLQYQLDNEGYLLLNGDYIYDSVGKKQQLSNEQIRYLRVK